MEGYRERALEELGRGVFDVLVIGGGIVGSRAAFDAARIGLRVALVDAGALQISGRLQGMRPRNPIARFRSRAAMIVIRRLPLPVCGDGRGSHEV